MKKVQAGSSLVKSRIVGTVGEIVVVRYVSVTQDERGMRMVLRREREVSMRSLSLILRAMLLFQFMDTLRL